MRRANGAVIRRDVKRAEWPPEAHVPPVLYPRWSDRCMAAFYDLSTERDYQVGLGGVSIGQIPWTAINAWGRARGLSGDVLAAFEVVIRRMDAAWLPIESERVRRELESSKGAGHG